MFKFTPLAVPVIAILFYFEAQYGKRQTACQGGYSQKKLPKFENKKCYLKNMNIGLRYFDIDSLHTLKLFLDESVPYHYIKTSS